MLGNAVKPTHILIVLIIVLLLFGAKRLPDLAKSVGQSLKIFKTEIKDLTDDNDTPAAPVAAPVVVPPVAPVAQPVAPAPAPSASTTPEVPAPAPAAGSDQPAS